MNMTVISKRMNFIKQTDMVLIKTVFTRFLHILKTVKNVKDRAFVHTKTEHFLPADFKNGRF